MKTLMIKTLPVILAAAFLANYAYLTYAVTGIFRQHRQIRVETNTVTDESLLENENSFVQNNEDLLNADYNNFYDDLKPYGTWIEVNLKNKSVESGTKTDEDKLSDAIISVLGIKDAKADVDIGWSVFFVWRPSPEMAVTVAAGEPAPAMYVPYTNGQWVYTDYGWYFRAGTPYEELTHHYGRWVYTVPYGWIWVPGNRWAPAWVSWDYDDDYIAWTPGSPGLYFAVNYYGLPYRLEPNYVVCERRHFLDPYVFRYSGFYREHDFERKFRDMELRNGNMYAGNKHFNFGPDVKRFEREYGKRIDPVHINTVMDRGKVKYGNKQYDVYAPRFKDKQNIFSHSKSGSERELKQINRNSLSSGTGKNFTDNRRTDNSKNGSNDNAFNPKNFRKGKDNTAGKDNNGIRNTGKNNNSRGKDNKGFNNTGKNNDRRGKDNSGFKNSGKNNERRGQDNYSWKNNRVDKSGNEKNFRRGQNNTGKQNYRVNSGKQKGNENTMPNRNNGRNDNRSVYKEQKGNQRGHR